MTEEAQKVVTFNDRVAQYHMVRDMVLRGRNHYRAWKQKQIDATRYYVSVEEDDNLFDELQKWLIKDVNPDEQRTLVAESDRTYDGDIGEYRHDLLVYADADFNDEVVIAGHRVEVEISTREAGKPKEDPLKDLLNGNAASGHVNYNVAAYTAKKRVIFTCDSKASRDAVLEFLREKTQKFNNRRSPGFYTALGYGSWKRTQNVMRRPLDSVILAGDDKERVVEDLGHFLSTEQQYLELGLPWHHGYLFEGPPGTGKTSLASAVAAHFGFDVYHIPLSSVENDSKLMDLVMNIETQRALLVMEDVDIVSATRKRDDQGKGITLQGLLNALDGIGTPHGLVTVMTTNDYNVLDKALIRPGRVDFTLHVGYLTDDQLARLCERFIHRTPKDLPAIKAEITPAEIVGIFKDGDNDEVDAKLREFILDANGKALKEEQSITGLYS